MTIHSSIHPNATSPHVLSRLADGLEERAFRIRQGRTFIPVCFNFLGDTGEPPGFRVVPSREDFSATGLVDSPNHQSPRFETANQRWASVLSRMIKARTVMAIERRSSPDGALMLREFTFSLTKPDGSEAVFPALLLGGHESTPDKLIGLDLILAEMMTILQSSRGEASYDNSTEALSRAKVHGLLPIPGPSAGWAFFHSWMLLFMTVNDYNKPRPLPYPYGATLKGPDKQQSTSCHDMMTAWMDKSMTWASDQPGRIEGIIRARSGY